MKQYLAIDIGGTAVKLGIVDEEGRVLSKTEQSVCFDNYETPILTTVLSAAEQFLKEQAVEPQGLAGIGVSAAGQIDTRKGIVAGTCGSLPNYIGSPIKAELEAKFGLPTTVANDANCMTLGEVWVGGAKGYTDVIGVTLGTGVGGGILTGGRLLEGARGLGGELGHFRTHALDGVFCTCGASGCWERYAATTALVRGAQPRNPKWKDGRAIFESAHAGDPIILALLDDWTDEIAQGLAGMVHIFNGSILDRNVAECFSQRLSVFYEYTITVRLFSVCDNVLRRKGVEKLSSAADDSTVIIQFVNRFKEEQSSFMYVCDIVGNFIQIACDMGRNKDGMVFLLCKFS